MNEVVSVQDGAPAPRVPSLAAGGRPMPIIPQTMDDAYRLGKAICLAGMAPKGMDSPEKCMIAIMRGLEVGFTPMQALDKIAIVNGRPTIWGDGALGLVRGSGVCEWIKETIEGTGDSMVARCEAKRRGEPASTPGEFSVADAKKAGLWGKAGPWQQYPKRMLQMRARAFCLRDGFADVIGGLYLKEELDGEDDRREPARRAPSASPAPMIEHQPEPDQPREMEASSKAIEKPAEKPVQTRRAPSATPAPAKQETTPAATGYDPDTVHKRFATALKAAKTEDDVNEAWMQIVDPFDAEILPPDRDDLARMASLRSSEITGGDGGGP